jgi:hypothetical protein
MGISACPTRFTMTMWMKLWGNVWIETNLGLISP